MNREEMAMLSIYEELSNDVRALEELVLSKAIQNSLIPAIILYAFCTENPTFTINEYIRLVRNRQAEDKVVSYASKVTKLNEMDTDNLLFAIIKDTPYFENKVRLQSRTHGI